MRSPSAAEFQKCGLQSRDLRAGLRARGNCQLLTKQNMFRVLDPVEAVLLARVLL